MIILTLPYPISANRYWQSFVPPGARRALVHVSTEAKAYRREVERIALAAGLLNPLQGRVQVGLQLYPARPQDYATRQRKLGAAWDDTVRCIDIDNANKVVLDALKGCVIEDDRWVRSLTTERMEPDANGARVVVYIRQLAVVQVQRTIEEAAA